MTRILWLVMIAGAIAGVVLMLMRGPAHGPVIGGGDGS